MNQDDQIKPWVRQVVAMAIVFDENDKTWIDSKYDGRVCLTKERWNHILSKHPESNLEMNWDKISDTLRQPDYAVPENNTRVYYRKFATEISLDNKETPLPKDRLFTTVVVQVMDKFIITIFQDDRIKERHQPKDEEK
jgi:hypothetical protein